MFPIPMIACSTQSRRGWRTWRTCWRETQLPLLGIQAERPAARRGCRPAFLFSLPLSNSLPLSPSPV